MVVPAGLEDAYRRTEFRVTDRGWSFVLRIDEASSVLTACHETFGVTRSAYLTAWNPRSEPTSIEVNQVAQLRLEAELTAAGSRISAVRGWIRPGSGPGSPVCWCWGFREMTHNGSDGHLARMRLWWPGGMRWRNC